MMNNELKDHADKICEEYARNQFYDDKGQLFLRDLYEEYNA